MRKVSPAGPAAETAQPPTGEAEASRRISPDFFAYTIRERTEREVTCTVKSRRDRNRKRGEADAPQPPEPKEVKLTKILDLPASALGGMCHMEISGNQEAIVDGCQGVLEYDEDVIKLAAGKMNVKFTGRNLQIKVLTHTSAVVGGFIVGVEFLT